jgi:hypothetical protein
MVLPTAFKVNMLRKKNLIYVKLFVVTIFHVTN